MKPESGWLLLQHLRHYYTDEHVLLGGLLLCTSLGLTDGCYYNDFCPLAACTAPSSTVRAH